MRPNHFRPGAPRCTLVAVVQNLLLWSVVLIGSACVAAGAVGVALPAGQRLEVLLALVAGAGSGLVVLAGEVLSGTGSGTQESDARLFLAATFVGWLTVMAALLALWLRSRRTAGGGNEQALRPVDR